jgi:dihydroneopterin aldolase
MDYRPSSQPLLGTIAVEGIEVHAFHGVYDVEKEKGNDFVIDVYLFAEISQSAYTDHLEDTLDYQKVYDLVLQEMKNPVNLLEYLARRIAERILNAFPSLHSVRLRVTKKKPLGMEACRSTYVEMLFDNTGQKGM